MPSNIIAVPTPHDPHPGRFVRHLDFNHFRTIGMRRSLEEGVTGRFVTGGRLLALLKVRRNCTFLAVIVRPMNSYINIVISRKCHT